jgi:NAD(P)-dependent dehydrogenase (short-subunit alcohol dehydrogenase family)
MASPQTLKSKHWRRNPVFMDWWHLSISRPTLLPSTKAVALENARVGVTVNAICPGFVLTPLIQKQIDIIREKRNISDAEASRALVKKKMQ